MSATAILWTLLITGGIIVVCILGLIALTVIIEAVGEPEDHFDTFKRD